jgi:hypothetical protein
MSTIENDCFAVVERDSIVRSRNGHPTLGSARAITLCTADTTTHVPNLDREFVETHHAHKVERIANEMQTRTQNQELTLLRAIAMSPATNAHQHLTDLIFE